MLAREFEVAVGVGELFGIKDIGHGDIIAEIRDRLPDTRYQ